MSASIFWYDFETTGTDPVMDRPVQFAGVRTDLDLYQMDDPVNLYSCPGDDVIPSPEAILITGLSMVQLQSTGLNETRFCQQVLSHFLEPQTCVAGYNSIRFDDEFTRQMCYRNFQDPYAREWRQGNSRWDVIDLFRMAFALRPDGLQWPMDEAGNPVFRLGALTEANGVKHDAHDAVSDVLATVELTRLLKEKQPKLFSFLFMLRQKKELISQLYPLGKTPIIHVSSMYGARRSCLAITLPICSHPDNSNGIICFDLSSETETLINASAEEIARLVFTSTRDLEEGETRIPLKTIHLNRCPAIAPLSTLSEHDEMRLGIDLALCKKRFRQLQTTSGLVEKVSDAFARRDFSETSDPDHMLYQGGFTDPVDRATMEQIHQSDVGQLHTFTGRFHHDQFDELLFRFRARNYPDSLSPGEKDRWHQFRWNRWQGGKQITKVMDEIDRLLTTHGESDCLRDLKSYLTTISATAGVL